MATLNALKRAPILDQDGTQLSVGHTVTSSDTAVVTVQRDYTQAVWAVGTGAGIATLTATRAVDGAVAVLEVEVVAATPFAITLGAEIPA